MSGKFSDERRASFAVLDMLDVIAKVENLVRDKHLADLQADPHVRAAYERYIEIISEASRRLPDHWKEQCGPQVDWRAIRDIGNRIRHGYDDLDLPTLWDIKAHDLLALQTALESMRASFGEITK